MLTLTEYCSMRFRKKFHYSLDNAVSWRLEALMDRYAGVNDHVFNYALDVLNLMYSDHKLELIENLIKAEMKTLKGFNAKRGLFLVAQELKAFH